MPQKTRFLAIGAAVALLGLPSLAGATVITLQPSPPDLGDLDHHKYVTWGISWSVPAGEHITSAVLAIDNLNDWTVEDGDVLYIHLLDEGLSGVRSWTDNEAGGDAFAGQGILLATYTDDDAGPNPPEDWSHPFTPTECDGLTDYAANGFFVLGFDPDCHYYNCGVSLTITTAPVPEPSGLGLLAVGLMRARRRR